MKTSILIPTRNEPRIQILVSRIHTTFRRNHEVIVIDKSRKTPKIKAARIIRQKSIGLGNAIKEGLRFVKGDIIVIMDGDGSHMPEDVPKMFSALKNADIVIGSRFARGGKTLDTAHRRIVSLIVRKFASFILGLNIRDNMSGFAAFKKEILENIRLNPLGYKIVLELAYKAKKKGYRIKEVPIIFQKREIGKSKAGIAELFRIIRLVFELRLGLR